MATGNKTGVAPISDSLPQKGEAADLPSENQLRWHCRRGMLELDVMLRRFLDHRYSALPMAEKAQFVALLNLEDDQLWDWLSGRVSPPDTLRKKLVEQIRRPAGT